MDEKTRAYYRQYEKTPKRRAWKRAYDKKRSLKPHRIAWRKAYIWGYALKHEYGLTRKEYEAFHAQQGGLCAMCREPAPIYKRTHRLYVDHNHTTKKVRGLLCQPCNIAVGWVERQSKRLALAHLYLAQAHGTLGNESKSPPNVAPLAARLRRFANPR